MSSLITYNIFSDREGKLKAAAKLSCNFWNKFIAPNSSIVINLGTFNSDDTVTEEDDHTIARAYTPYTANGIIYGYVEFNIKFLSTFSEYNIVTTLIHEIGHTLGFGFGKWNEMFDKNTGLFHKEYIDKLPSLEEMHVERDHGEGTELAHWDEERHDKELMTGIKDDSPEHVLPVTIDIMKLLGHDVIETLPEKTMLVDIVEELRRITFTRIEEAKMLDRDYYEETELLEVIYTK